MIVDVKQPNLSIRLRMQRSQSRKLTMYIRKHRKIIILFALDRS